MGRIPIGAYDSGLRNRTTSSSQGARGSCISAIKSLSLAYLGRVSVRRGNQRYSNGEQRRAFRRCAISAQNWCRAWRELRDNSTKPGALRRHFEFNMGFFRLKVGIDLINVTHHVEVVGALLFRCVLQRLTEIGTDGRVHLSGRAAERSVGAIWSTIFAV